MQTRARLALDRQQLAVAPQVFRPPLDRLACHRLCRQGVVVDDFQRAQALVADPERVGWEAGLTEVTAKRETHEDDSFPAPETAGCLAPNGWCTCSLLIV